MRGTARSFPDRVRDAAARAKCLKSIQVIRRRAVARRMMASARKAGRPPVIPLCTKRTPGWPRNVVGGISSLRRAAGTGLGAPPPGSMLNAVINRGAGLLVRHHSSPVLATHVTTMDRLAP
jgi:hypothetical protein